ncbi:hypothetical protein Brms1b_005331 [Colletotrichum noveboracense]|nr:hypothetical protein Brms1b_005331 [Colletotrichum noveboracense]
MHEIITLQLGELSNYAATHFWNTQESYFTYPAEDESPVNHNVHWRPGVALDGSETFLPRTIIYDLKGGFGSLRKINALYDASDESPPTHLWSVQSISPHQNGPLFPQSCSPHDREGSAHVHKQPEIEQSAYQQSLDLGAPAPTLKPSDVRYWSDFSRVFYHPKSLNQLYDYELNSSIMPFDKWSLGKELFDGLDREHDIVDRDFRPFIEEADQTQGFQIVTTIDDAWGGFATEYIQRLRDEYGKTPIWVWGLQAPAPGLMIDQRRMQAANTARTVKDLCEHASMMVPMALPHGRLPSNINLNLQSLWHTSALLSTAMETATIASRLNSQVGGSSPQASLGDLVSGLNLQGKQTMSRLQLSVTGPKSISSAGINHVDDHTKLDVDFFDILRTKPLPRKRSLEESASTPHFFGHTVTTRGQAQISEDSKQRYRPRAALVETSTQRYHTEKGFPMLDSFPHIYPDRSDKTSPDTLGTIASLSTDTSVSAAMKELRIAVASSIGVEDREDISNELADLAEAYREGWSSGSDNDDDDDYC